jgi:hypothetical protein
MTTAHLTPDLDALLTGGERFAPTYGNGLSNHLPMVLIALDRLGASPAELKAHAQHYARRLEPVLASEMVIDPAKPGAHLGDWSSFSAWHDFFRGALLREGIDKTLALHWPMLMPGIASAGFHALIRLAYGLEANHRGEIASALAYMASSFTRLLTGSADMPRNAESVALALEPMRLAFAGRTIEADLIIEELQLVTDDPGFFPALRSPPLASLQDRERMLADTARTAIRLYLAAPSFNSLHLVTGTHALSVVLPNLPEPLHAETQFYFWVAFCAGYAAIGAPQAAELQPAADSDLKAITDAVRRSGKEHSIKLVYSCRAEYRKTKDPAYLVAAAKII